MNNYAVGSVIRKSFNTHVNGVPFTLAGSPAVVVYKNDGTTESTAGVTLTVDYDSITGLNRVAINTAADGTFYAAGSDFEIVLIVGTVDGNSIAGTVLGSFSLANRVAGLLDGAITAAKIADGAITAAKAPNLDAAVSSRLATGSYTAPPTAGNIADAVWDESKTSHIVANSYGAELQNLSSDLGAVPTAEEINTAVEGGAVGTNAAAAKTNTDPLASMIASGKYTTAALENAPSGGGVTIPVNQVAVPAEQTWLVTSRGSALVGELALYMYENEVKLFACDFRRVLPTNGTLDDISTVTIMSALDADGQPIVGGLTFDTDASDTFGVDGTQAKYEIQANTAGTYVLEVTVSLAPAVGGGTAKARVKLVVRD